MKNIFDSDSVLLFTMAAALVFVIVVTGSLASEHGRCGEAVKHMVTSSDSVKVLRSGCKF